MRVCEPGTRKQAPLTVISGSVIAVISGSVITVISGSVIASATLPHMVLPEVCVCYLIRSTRRGDEVLLGRKKFGLGEGNLVGPGGKLEQGESPTDAVIREIHEEVGVTVAASALTLIGELSYPFPHRPAWSQKSWAFVCRDWSGEPVESDELAPEWFPLDAIPTHRMWDDAKYWLPRALAGEFVRATFTFGADLSSVESSRFA